MDIKFEKKDNTAGFYLFDNNMQIGEITFIFINDNVINVNHTFVSDKYTGQGLAKVLFNKVIDYAKDNNLKIIAECSYVKRCFDKDESIKYLLY